MKKILLLGLGIFLLLILMPVVNSAALINSTFETNTTEGWLVHRAGVIDINNSVPINDTASLWGYATGTNYQAMYHNHTERSGVGNYTTYTMWVRMYDVGGANRAYIILDDADDVGDFYWTNAHYIDCIFGGNWFKGAVNSGLTCAVTRKIQAIVNFTGGGGSLTEWRIDDFQFVNNSVDDAGNMNDVNKLVFSGKLNADGFMIDDVCVCPGLWNATCCNASGAPPGPGANQTINISDGNPATAAAYNNLPIRFNATVNATYTPGTNCSLYLNGTANITVFDIANSTNTFVNFTLHNISEGNTTWFIGCRDNTSTANTTLKWFRFDYQPPVIKDAFNNNTMVYRTRNLTGQFNFSDNLLLHSLNVTVDDISYYVVDHIHLNNYSYNMSLNISNLTSGNHTLRVQVADGHTLGELKDGDAYNPSTGVFKNYMKYSFDNPYQDIYIKTSLKDDSLMDSWSYIQEKDRYREIIEPSTPGSTQTFIVESDKRIYIARVPGKYKGEWLIIGNHWKDFVLHDEPGSKVSISQINPYEVEVTITNITRNPQELVFDSIGDLNIVNVTYTFINLNMTETFQNPIFNNVSTDFTLFVDFGGILGFPIAGLTPTAVLTWNSTNYTSTLVSFTNQNASFTQSITPPQVVNSTVINHRWNFNLTNLTTGWQSTTNQSQLLINVTTGICAPGLPYPILNITHFNELNSQQINFTNTYDVAIYDGTTWFNQTGIQDNVSTWAFCTNINPANQTYNWNLWEDFEIKLDGYVTRVVSIDPAAPILMSNNPSQNLSLFLIPIANSTTITFNWLTTNYALIDGTMRAFECVNNTQTMVDSTPVTSGEVTMNLQLLVQPYAYDIIIGGRLFQDFNTYSKCHEESVTERTFYVDTGVSPGPVVGFNSVPCFLERIENDTVNMTWGVSGTTYIQGCILGLSSSIYGFSTVWQNCSTSGYEFSVNHSGFPAFQTLAGTLTQGSQVKTCGNEISVTGSPTTAPGQFGLIALFGAALFVAAIGLMFAGDGTVQIVGTGVGLIAIWFLGLLRIEWVTIASIVAFLILILIIGRGARQTR